MGFRGSRVQIPPSRSNDQRGFYSLWSFVFSDLVYLLCTFLGRKHGSHILRPTSLAVARTMNPFRAAAVWRRAFHPVGLDNRLERIPARRSLRSFGSNAMVCSRRADS